MAEWSHLPNAPHIDLVLSKIRVVPYYWKEQPFIKHEIWSATRNQVYVLNRRAAWEAAAYQCSTISRSIARTGILALVAFDHAAKYLMMTSDQLRIWAELSEDPCAIMMLPAVGALEKTEKHLRDMNTDWAPCTQ